MDFNTFDSFYPETQKDRHKLISAYEQKLAAGRQRASIKPDCDVRD